MAEKEEKLSREQVETRRCLMEAARKWKTLKPGGMSEMELIDLAKPFWRATNGIFSSITAKNEIASLVAIDHLERTVSWRLKLGSKAPVEQGPSKTIFEKIPLSEWVISNDLAYAVYDACPVSKGHMLFITKRPVKDWFEASPREQDAIFELIERAKETLDKELSPDGYNIGINCGKAAGQTVMHLHVHLIPRFEGDMADLREGVRHAIPERGSYISGQPMPPSFEPAKPAELRVEPAKPASATAEPPALPTKPTKPTKKSKSRG